jgi:hypothetical protein
MPLLTAWTILPTRFRAQRVAMRLLTWWSVPLTARRTGRTAPIDRLVREALLARELFLTPALIPRLFGILERLPRIAMLPSRPPVAVAMLIADAIISDTIRARTRRLRAARLGGPTRRGATAVRSRSTVALALARTMAPTVAPGDFRSIVAKPWSRRPSRLGRVPQLSAREPFHLSVGMFLLQPLKRRHELLTVRRPERGWQAVGDDRPVRETRWHGVPSSVRHNGTPRLRGTEKNSLRFSVSRRLGVS